MAPPPPPGSPLCSSPRRTFASGIVHDEETQSRSIPQSTRPDGTLRKERRVRPGYTPQEDIARFRPRRLMDDDARRAQGRVVGGGRPGSASYVAAATSATSATTGSPRASSTRYSSHLVALTPPPAPSSASAAVSPAAHRRPLRAVKIDESSETPASSISAQTKSSSSSASRSIPPRGLFARAMGGVATQERAEHRRAQDTTSPRQGAEAKTNGKQTSMALRSNRDGSDTERKNRGAPRLPPSSLPLDNWRRGSAPTTPSSTSSGTTAKQSSADAVDELTEGLGSLQVDKKRGDDT